MTVLPRTTSLQHLCDKSATNSCSLSRRIICTDDCPHSGVSCLGDLSLTRSFGHRLGPAKAEQQSSHLASAAMKDVLKAYRRILRLTNLLPAESRGYYRNYARENFVNYKDETDPQVVQALLRRAYDHSVWVLNKVGRLLLSGLQGVPNQTRCQALAAGTGKRGPKLTALVACTGADNACLFCSALLPVCVRQSGGSAEGVLQGVSERAGWRRDGSSPAVFGSTGMLCLVWGLTTCVCLNATVCHGMEHVFVSSPSDWKHMHNSSKTVGFQSTS